MLVMATVNKMYRVQVKGRPNIQGQVSTILKDGIEVKWDRGGVTLESPSDIEAVQGASLAEYLHAQGKLKT
jgi:energy-converting hydrogenase Eha subunit F